MRVWHGLGAMLAVGVAVIVGCSSGGSNTCVESGAPVSGAGQADSCAIAGGTCSSSGGGVSTCGPNMHPAPSGSLEANSCSNNSYGGGYSNCGPYIATGAAGLQPAPGTCCLPDLDAGSDGSTDASDDGGDAGSGIGSCAGSPCDPGCACGLLPGPGTPACLCEGADAGDAAAPNCGSIYCFAGCTCADEGTSTCTCP